MNRHGDRRGRIWITELGWGDTRARSTGSSSGATGQAQPDRAGLRGDQEAATPLGLSGVVYYCWRDAPPYPPQYEDLWGLHTGLLDINGGVQARLPRLQERAWVACVARDRQNAVRWAT